MLEMALRHDRRYIYIQVGVRQLSPSAHSGVTAHRKGAMSDVSAKRTRELYVYARNKQTSKLRSFAGRRVSSFSKSHRRRPLRASLRTLGVFT
jgi:hypothetical protein